MCEGEGEKRKDSYAGKPIFTTRMSIDLWNRTSNRRGDQRQLHKNVVDRKYIIHGSC